MADDRMRDIGWTPGLGWVDPKSKSVWSPSLNGWVKADGVFYDGKAAQMPQQLDQAKGGRVMAIAKKLQNHFGSEVSPPPAPMNGTASPPPMPSVQSTPKPSAPILGSIPMSSPAPAAGGFSNTFSGMRNGFGG